MLLSPKQQTLHPEYKPRNILLERTNAESCGPGKPKKSEYLLIENLLSEFDSEEQRLAVIRNLGLENQISWGNISGKIEDQKDVYNLVQTLLEKYELKIDPSLLIHDVVELLPTENIANNKLYAQGPHDIDGTLVYKLYVYDGVQWKYLGFLNSSSIDIVLETGSNANVVMSQKAVTEALRPVLVTEEEYEEIYPTLSNDDMTVFYIYEKSEEDDIVTETHPTYPFVAIIPQNYQDNIWWESDRIDNTTTALGYYFMDIPSGFFILANIDEMDLHLANPDLGIYVSTQHDVLLDYNTSLSNPVAKQNTYFRSYADGNVYTYDPNIKQLVKLNVKLDANNNVLIYGN